MMTYTVARQGITDMVEICRIANDAGLDTMDQVTLYDYSAKDIRRIADDHGIKIVSYTFFADLNYPDLSERKAGQDEILKGLEIATILGSPIIMLPISGKPEYTRDQSRSHWIAGLKEIMPKVQASGIKLTVEHFPQAISPFITSDDMEIAIREVPGFCVTFDSGNMLTAGEDPCFAFMRHKDNILHTHFKDWTLADQGMEGLDGRHYRPALVGEGVVPYRKLLATMKKCDYKGYIDIEYENNDYPAADAVKRAVNYLRNLETSIESLSQKRNGPV
jgi:sugar phosphate isomerase/epimerase